MSSKRIRRVTSSTLAAELAVAIGVGTEFHLNLSIPAYVPQGFIANSDANDVHKKIQAARLFVERRMADGQPPEEARLCEEVSRAAGVQASPAAAGPAAADASPAAAVQTSQPAALGSSHSSDEDRPLCQAQAAAGAVAHDPLDLRVFDELPAKEAGEAREIRSELPDSSEEDRPLCRRHVRRPAAEVPESSDEDKPLSQLKKRRRRSSPIESEEDTPLAQRAVQGAAARLATPRVETARLVALGVPAERATGVARFISSLPPHTRTGFELAYAYAAAL